MPVIVMLIALIVVVVAVVALLATRSIRLQWEDAAQRLGAAVEASSLGHPRIAGTVDGFAVVVDVKGSGDNARTRYRVTFPPVSAPFELRREGGSQRILRLLGVDDVQLGDPEFDTAFVVKTDTPSELGDYLTAARRFSLLRLQAAHRDVVTTESSLEVTSRRVEGKAERIEATVRRLTAAARHLVGTATTPALDRALAARAAGDLGEALDRVDRVVTEDPADLDARLLQADAALAAGDDERFRAATEAIGGALPTDPEAESLRTAAVQLRTGAGRLTPADEPLTNEGAMAMFEEVFGGDRLSFESEADFTTHHRGRRVRWSGRVKSTRAYDRDRDFGAGPGVKAVITVATIESDLYGNAAVDAVVALPTRLGAPLGRGDMVSFTGTLDKADAMMRNVFVRDGALVDT